jgi:hypothetical protein
MDLEFENVKHALTRLDRIQAEHIESFQTQLLPDLEYQTALRQEAFDSLTTRLNIFLGQADRYDKEQMTSMVLWVKEQVSGLQHQNLMLKECVEAYKNDLKERMNGLTRGKRALGSYGPSSSFSKRPRVISLTN